MIYDATTWVGYSHASNATTFTLSSLTYASSYYDVGPPEFVPVIDPDPPHWCSAPSVDVRSPPVLLLGTARPVTRVPTSRRHRPSPRRFVGADS